jgi:hypothetical protein
MVRRYTCNSRDMVRRYTCNRRDRFMGPLIGIAYHIKGVQKYEQIVKSLLNFLTVKNNK